MGEKMVNSCEIDPITSMFSESGQVCASSNVSANNHRRRLCDVCVDKQDWLLENNDGSQVICTCSDNDIQNTTPEMSMTGSSKSGIDSALDLIGDSYNWRRLHLVSDMRWAILSLDIIQSSACRYSIQRLYIGTKDDSDCLEMEFFPCTTYRSLLEEGKDLSDIRNLLSYNNIEIIIFNVEGSSYGVEVYAIICDGLGVQYLNINETAADYIPIVKNWCGKKVIAKDIKDSL